MGHGQSRGMPEPVLVHPSVRPLQRSIKRCEPYAEKQIIALRQKPGAIRHTQLTASATRTPAAKLCVNSWCRLSFPSNARLMGKSKSGKLASYTSTPRRRRYWRHCAASRICSCFAKTRKVQNPAKLCAIGEAIGQNVNGLTRAQQTGRIGFVY